MVPFLGQNGAIFGPPCILRYLSNAAAFANNTLCDKNVALNLVVVCWHYSTVYDLWWYSQFTENECIKESHPQSKAIT